VFRGLCFTPKYPLNPILDRVELVANKSNFVLTQSVCSNPDCLQTILSIFTIYSDPDCLQTVLSIFTIYFDPDCLQTVLSIFTIYSDPDCLQTALPMFSLGTNQSSFEILGNSPTILMD